MRRSPLGLAIAPTVVGAALLLQTSAVLPSAQARAWGSGLALLAALGAWRAAARAPRIAALLALAARDTARGLQNSGFKVANFEVKNPDSANPPKQLLITLEASGQDYPGWLQQEPIARSFLLSTALLQGVRKAPTSGTGSSAANSYRLEGLIEVAPLLRDYKQRVKPVQALVARPSAAASPSTPAAAQASSAAPTAPEAATTPANTRELLP
jgi:hypothetical protein